MRERREYAAAHALVGVTKLLLAAALLVAAVQSYLLSRHRVPPEGRRMIHVVALVLLAGSGAAAASGARAVRAARDVARSPLDAPDDPGAARREGETRGPTA